MNQPDPPSTGESFLSIARAIRFAFVVLILGLSALAVHSAMRIHWFEALFSDMMAGKPLPLITRFVLQYQLAVQIVVITIPVCALLTLLDRKLARAFYVLGVLVAVVLVGTAMLHLALLVPLQEVVVGMANPGQ